MSTFIEATFDGQVFRPTQPVALEPNAPVKLTVEVAAPSPQEETGVRKEESHLFLDALRSIRIEGPPDWSANADKYLYGHLHDEEPDGEV